MAAGTQLKNIVFEVVNSEGVVDDTIHNEEKNGQSHTLTVKAESFNTEELIRYTFKHGRCNVPSIPVSHKGGVFCFVASHSRHTELSLNVEVGNNFTYYSKLLLTAMEYTHKFSAGSCNANCGTTRV